MRSLLLAVLAILAIVASGDEDNNPPKFIPRTFHRYRYEAQLVTGAELSSNMWSGLRLTSNIKLYFVSETRIAAKLVNVNLQKFDKMVEDRTPAFFLQSEDRLLDGVEAGVNNVMVAELEKPFAFKWQNGHVDEIIFDESDPLWSKNIKRGMLNLLQVNLNPLKINPLISPARPFDANQPPYSVWEETPFGRCLTTYTPQPNDDEKSEGSNRFYVTKVRDYDTCLKTPHMAFVFDNVMSQDNSSDKHLVVGGEISYAIEGNSDNFRIMTAVGESKLYFYPYGIKKGSVQTSINQTMYLVESKTIPRRLPEDVAVLVKRKEHYSKLPMVLPIESVQNLEPYVLFQPPEPPKSTPLKIKENMDPLWSKGKMDQLLTWIANATSKYPSEDGLQSQQQLMEMIHGSKPFTLRKLLDELIDSEHETLIGPIKLKIFWQLLSNAGTTCATEVLLGRCVSNYGKMQKEEYHRCISALTCIGEFSPPSEVILNKMIDLIQKTMSKETGDEKMKMVSVLSTGAVVGRAVDMYLDILKFSQKQVGLDLTNRLQEIKTKHDIILGKFDMVVRKLTNATSASDYEIILGMTALRNAHMPKMDIQTMKLKDTHLKPSVRMAAALAFEKLRTNKKEARHILVEIVKNPAECAAVRIQAARSMINLNPPVHTLIRLAGSIRYEQSRQVSTYIWSAFNQLVNSTFKPYRQAAHKIQSAMHFIQPVQYGMQDSHYRNLEIDIHKDAGIMSEMSYVSTSSPDFVTALDGGLFVSMFGANSKFGQLSTITEGFEHVIKKMVGPKGFFTQRNSIFDLLKRPKRDTDYSLQLEQIFKVLKIKSREIPKETGYISMQSMNNVLRLWDYTNFLEELVDNEDVIFSASNQENLKDGVTFNYNMTGITHQYYMELPSEAGFPIHLQMGMSYSAKIDGAAHAEVRENLFKKVRENNPPTYLNAGLYVEPRVVTSLSGRMYVDGYIFQAGTLIKAQMDVKARFYVNASVNLKLGRVQATLAPPLSMDMPVMKFDMQPYVYSRAIANDVNSQELKVNKRPFFYTMQPIVIGNGAEVQQMQQTLGKNCLGFDVRLESQYPWRAHHYTPYMPLNGRSYYAVYLTADEQPPAVLSADFRYFNPRKQDTGKIKMPDFPDLGADLDYLSVKNKMQEYLGQNIPMVTPHAFVLVLNSSRISMDEEEGKEELVDRRSAVLSGLMESFNHGLIHRNYFNLIRTPTPGQESEPWKMTINMTGLYVPRKQHLSNLTDTVYQKELLEYMLMFMQNPNHRVINKYFKELVLTKMSEQHMRRLPSLNRDFVLDSALAEIVQKLDKTDSKFSPKIHEIMRIVLPITHQLIDLQSELKDAFKLAKKIGLLTELKLQIKQVQIDVKTLLDRISKETLVRPAVVYPSTAYVVYKLSEAVFIFEEIAERSNITIEDMHKLQKNVYTACRKALGKTPASSELNKMIAIQLKVIKSVFRAKDNSMFKPKVIKDMKNLIQILTPEVLRMLNEKVQKKQKYYVLQGAIQHQILVKMMHTLRFGKHSKISENRYSLKVQTKQLLERFIYLQRLIKLEDTCIPAVGADMRSILDQLKTAGFQLLNLQFEHVKMPQVYLPYTTDRPELELAHDSLTKIMISLTAVRSQLLNLGRLPEPCLTLEFADTVFTLQQKVDIFRKMLTAQEEYPAKLIAKYRKMEADVNKLILSMSPVFDLYYTMVATDQPMIFPTGASDPPENEDPPKGLIDMPEVMGSSEEEEDEDIDSADNPVSVDKAVNDAFQQTGAIFNINITYGPQNKNHLELQLLAKKSMEQMLWETFQFYPTTRDVCVAQALKDQIVGRDKMEMCGQQIERRLNTYNHLHLKLQSNQEKLPVSLSSYVKQMMRRMRYKYHDRSDYGESRDYIHPNTMETILDLSPFMNSVNMYFMTEDETNYFRSAPVSPLVKPFYPFQNVDTVPRMAIKDYSAQLLPAVCKVDHGSLRTFDSAIIPFFPFSNKEYRNRTTLIAMDCSDDKTFAVTTMCEPGSIAQTLRILTHEHEVIIPPSITTYRVEIDGQVKILQPGEPIIISKGDAYGEQITSLMIILEANGFLRVEYPLVGLKIHMKGMYTDIQSSIVYKNQMCGICGNFDGQMTKELEGPERYIYTAAEPFVRSYVYPWNPKWKRPTYKKKLPVNRSEVPPYTMG